MIILIIALLSYYVAINAYGAMMIAMQKKENENAATKSCDETQKNDSIYPEKEDNSILESHTEKGSVILIEGKCEENDSKIKHNFVEKTQNENAKTDKKKPSEKPKKEKSAIFSSKNTVTDFQLAIAAIFGGSLGMFISLIVLRYRLKNMLFMVGLPVISAVYISLIVLLISRNGLFVA